jgi:hypothetical protein
MYILITGIEVDVEVRSKNKDDKTGSAQKECNKKDGKNGSEEIHTSAMEVDDKHDEEANAARSERESPESEGWTVVNDATANHVVNDATANHVMNDDAAANHVNDATENHVMNDATANHVMNDTTANHVLNDTTANQSKILVFCVFYMSCLE